MVFKIISIFPDIFSQYFRESIIGRAQKNKIIKIENYDLRRWTFDKHHSVDDTPYGGGAGMVLKVEPIYKALEELFGPAQKTAKPFSKPNRKIILFSAKGKRWTQERVQEYSRLDEVVMICGRYEGVDERVLKFIDEEISIGDFVLTGGELPAMLLVDSISRLLPGVLGNSQSYETESHSNKGVLEYPQYTKPEVFEANGKKYKVPDVLLSGHHLKIEEWRKSKSKKVKKRLA